MTHLFLQANTLFTWTIAPSSVQMIATSPPYWGLRDYGTATWEGGRDDCDHVQVTREMKHNKSTLGPNRDGLRVDNAAFAGKEVQYRDLCAKCGAIRIDRQFGLERVPDCLGWARRPVVGMIEVDIEAEDENGNGERVFYHEGKAMRPVYGPMELCGAW